MQSPSILPMDLNRLPPYLGLFGIVLFLGPFIIDKGHQFFVHRSDALLELLTSLIKMLILFFEALYCLPIPPSSCLLLLLPLLRSVMTIIVIIILFLFFISSFCHYQAYHFLRCSVPLFYSHSHSLLHQLLSLFVFVYYPRFPLCCFPPSVPHDLTKGFERHYPISSYTRSQ